jgi:hypothetical protein
MSVRILGIGVGVMLTLLGCGTTAKGDQAELDRLVGQPVDIAPWAYAWRAGLAVQEKPEAYFIPRRLERIDKVYRTAYTALPQSELKSIYYNMPDLLSPLLPQPKGQLLAGLLWTGKLADYQVELQWPVSAQAPLPEAVEVRVYPTSYGWFGWTVDRILSQPQVSADGRTWTYKSQPPLKMDFCYSVQVDAATEMVAVFCTDKKAAVPTIRVTSPKVGVWKRMDVELEWGFQPGTEKQAFGGRVESSLGIIGSVTPLAGDKQTKVKDAHSWQSPGARGTRRGITVPLLYTSGDDLALDTRITVWSGTNGFSFRPRELENRPMLIAHQGVFVTRKTAGGQTAREFAKDLAARKLKSVRQMTREHREAASWEELMQQVRLWTCPERTKVLPFPQVREPAMQVQVPDPRWTEMWRQANEQLRGPHLWPNLAHEVGRVVRAMELVGLHAETLKVYDYFLQSPGVKSDGDYADGKGSLEWAKSMRHDMGYSHEGTHASTGRMLLSMAERYFLAGDKAYFQTNRARLQAAADWIIRERNGYMKDVPNRKDLFVAGLMPPCMLGDYALPACDWHWYYGDDVLALQGLQRFADALSDIDQGAGLRYRQEAEAFRADLRRALEQEAALAPVRLGRDGMHHTYIPRMAYARGLTGPELGAPQFPECDLAWGSLLVGETFAALDANDPRVVDTLDVMEEMGTSVSTVQKLEAARKARGFPTEDAWFWMAYFLLPKISENSNIYLLEDDVPNFLRYWMNHYALIVGANGKMWEHWRLPGGWPNSLAVGDYAPCTTPDNGTAGWFIENFRNLLVMEDGPSLWIARATPRAWLRQGSKVTVSNAPTYFGTLAYEIVSDADHGRITATVEVPHRNPPKSILLRLRHPESAPIRSVRVNGKRWSRFNPDKEVIQLTGLTGTATVVANYKTSKPAPRPRRVLYNFDGDSCLATKAGSKGPVPVTAADVKRLIEEVAYKGSRVDTILVCVNAQVMYYPTKAGTMRGTLATPAERAQWPASEQQRFKNLQAFFDAGADPYAILFAEARRRGREALLTFRMNDDHGDTFLRTQFKTDHPDWLLGGERYHGRDALDFGRAEVRDYTARLIEEAVRRYDCDGLELDFNRFPEFFKDGTTEQRVLKMNSLVERVRRMLDDVGRERGRRLVLAVRVPSNYGVTPPTPETARQLGCDVPAWVRYGWVDYVVVSEFLFERGDLPIAAWKQVIPTVSVYRGIECTRGGGQKNLSADDYRRAAAALVKQWADGVYLFNFFTSREGGADAYEPPYACLRELGASPSGK